MAGNHSAGQMEDWALGASWLHRRDARAKILAALALLIGLSFAPKASSAPIALFAWMLVIATGTAGLPMLAAATRAAAVLPFAGVFALLTWISGDPVRAQTLLAKSYLSAWAVVLLMGTTPLSSLLAGFERLGVPRLVTEVVQMMIRYLRVLTARASAMRWAAASRGGSWTAFSFGPRAHRRAGAGMFAALFGDAMHRSERIHQAMLARGYRGHFPLLRAQAWSIADSALTLTVAAIAMAWRWLA